ncbi:MAG TPA: tRNA epoxyqueuosine(34) reductase QueG [Gemmatimonadales bacterium]|nr:tRNA epoxyqueuosine(34) reductase QueG [Gemmatimonadales bacterium]
MSDRPVPAEALRAAAERLGFLACGVASLEPSRHGDALERWLRAGYAGTMRYLHRQARKRKHPADIAPGATVAVVVLENYLPGTASAGEPEAASRRVKVAKYARGGDYHLVLQRRLGLLAAWLREQGATVALTWADAGPVPERELAQRAGLGWIGKNTMLIRPDAGSFCLIGTIFTDLALEPTPGADYDRCGSCTRCLDACPTQAFVEPRLLDATRCISYLTIESRRPIPEALADRLEGWGFGCDICNDVCPWNLRFAEPTGVPEYQDRGAIADEDPGFFDRLDEAEFIRRFGDTPLERPGLAGMRRNWAAAFNSLEELA